MDTNFSLPGIRSIAYVKSESLSPDLAMMYRAGTPICVYAPRTSLSFVGTPTCEVETTNENKGQKQTVTLTFNTLDIVPEEFAIAFIVTDMNGQSYLIGLHSEPYPLIDCLKSFGSPDGDAHSLAVTVTYVSAAAFIPIMLPE